MKDKTIVFSTSPLIERSKLNKLNNLIELTKFRLLSLVLITTGIGLYLASPILDLWLLAHTLMGTALVGGGANALNQWYEQPLDARMSRTRHRPLPSGRLSPKEAQIFGLAISIAGMAYLSWTVNTITAVIGFLTWASYLFLYTPLKQKTILNTWIGAVPGALPPVMGWVAVTGSFDLPALALFAILYFWQLPHFFAIAWLYRDDYAEGGFRMLPHVDPEGHHTTMQMLINTCLLVIASMMPYVLGLTGIYYFYSTLPLGGLFLAAIWQFWAHKDKTSARRVFFASILYLPVLLTIMVVDKI